MKLSWILSLLMVVSCGKNISPKESDLNDDDGDTIPNSLDASPFITDYKDPADVNGKIRFYIDSNLIEKDISNTLSKNKRITDLLTKGDLESFKNLSDSDKSIFSMSPVKLPRLSGNSYKVEIQTELSTNQIENFQLIEGSSIKLQLDWKPLIKLELLAEDIEALARGSIKIKMIMKSAHQQVTGLELDRNIEERTYKVLYQQGNTSRVFRVAKKIQFHDFFKNYAY